MRPGSAGGPYMKPHTTSSAASTKQAMTWKTCGATIVAPVSSPGSVQKVVKAMVVSTSQRHIRIRASAKAAAVTIAR